jgi:hypothetical protein
VLCSINSTLSTVLERFVLYIKSYRKEVWMSTAKFLGNENGEFGLNQ